MKFEKWEEETFNYFTKLYDNFFEELSSKCKHHDVGYCNKYECKCFYCSMYLKERKTPRKRCKTCEHFLYSYNEKTRKYGYCCEISGEFAKSYNQLKDCKSPNYKKKS